MRLILTIAALIAATPAAAQTGEAPDWLSGRWCTEGGAERTCEDWSPVVNGMLAGVSTTMRGGETVSSEAMTIRPVEGRLRFTAVPRGGTATDFPLETGGARDLTFVNAAHDYPQRIRYWREGDALMAEISMADGSRPMRWTYRRAE